MTQQSINVSEALRRAREEDQDVFLASLNKEQLEKSGFDTSVFGSFELVNVYILWDGEFVLKYIFDADPREFYYEKESEIGGREGLLEAVQEYLEIGGE